MTFRGWGRYSDINIYIQVRSIIFGSKFQKSNTFGSMMICGFFFFLGGGGWGGGGRGSLRIQTIFFIYLFIFLFFFFFGGGGSFLYIIGLFKVKIQNGNIFWAAKFQKNYRYACYS